MAPGADSVIMNVTTTNTPAQSFLAVAGSNASSSTPSSLNWKTGQTVMNNLTTRLGFDGAARAYNAAGNADVIFDVAGFYRPMEEAGTRLIAKSMDDRIGVAILIETLRLLKRTPHEVCFVFSVQEEVGLRGAEVAAFGHHQQPRHR